MNRHFFLLSCLLLGVSGCSSSQDPDIESVLESYESSVESANEIFEDLEGSDYLQAVYDRSIEQYGPVSTAAFGEIVDDETNHRLFSYAYHVADVTDLDFVQLATVEYQNGLWGVDDVIDHMNPSDLGYEEVHHFQSLHWLTSSLYEEEATAYLDSLQDPSLSASAQQDVYLQAFSDAWGLMVYDAPSSINATYYSESATCSTVTGLDFETLATIQYKGGTYGLELMIQRFPNLEHKEDCLAVFEG